MSSSVFYFLLGARPRVLWLFSGWFDYCFETFVGIYKMGEGPVWRFAMDLNF